MKIEKISDNQVKCTLSSFELSLRNLKVGELAYGKNIYLCGDEQTFKPGSQLF